MIKTYFIVCKTHPSISCFDINNIINKLLDYKQFNFLKYILFYFTYSLKNGRQLCRLFVQLIYCQYFCPSLVGL